MRWVLVLSGTSTLCNAKQPVVMRLSLHAFSNLRPTCICYALAQNRRGAEELQPAIVGASSIASGVMSHLHASRRE